jgi:hypothetical protein
MDSIIYYKYRDSNTDSYRIILSATAILFSDTLGGINMINMNIENIIRKYKLEVKPISYIMEYYGFPPSVYSKMAPRILIQFRNYYYLNQVDDYDYLVSP